MLTTHRLGRMSLLFPLVPVVCLCRAETSTLGFRYGLLALSTSACRSRRPLEILDLRHFSSLDLRPLLDDETQLWSRLLSWDYTSSAEMILRYVDAKILPGYAAVDRGRVFGYS